MDKIFTDAPMFSYDDFLYEGMMGGHKHESHTSNDLDKKMMNLMLDNEKLRREINTLSSLVKKQTKQ